MGPILGGVIAETFNLRMVYYAAGVLFAVSTLIILFIKKQPIEDMTILDGDGHLLRNRRFVSLLAVIALVMLAVTLPQPLTANFLQNQRALPLGRIGQLGSLGALGSVLMMLIFGNLPAGVAMVIGQAGVMLFVLFIWHGGGFIWYGLGYLFLGGYRLCRVMTVALVQPVVREREVGLAFGMVESLSALAFMIAPVLAGFLYDWRPESIYPIGLLVLILAILLSLRYLDVRRRGKPLTKV
jgi:MFS family permease